MAMKTERSLAEDAKHTLFYFHSCGGDGWHALSLLRALQNYANPNDFKVVVPVAPNRIEDGPGNPSKSWFLYKSTTDGPHVKHETILLREVREYLKISLQEEYERVCRTGGKNFLTGTSQGCSVMTDLILHCNPDILKKVALVVVNRGWVEAVSLRDLKKEKREYLKAQKKD